jgi:hypothetical protein
MRLKGKRRWLFVALYLVGWIALGFTLEAVRLFK